MNQPQFHNVIATIRICLLFLVFHPAAGVSGWHVPAAEISQPKASSELLQFKSVGHVLGFSPGGLHISNGTYVLHVEFMGAAAVTPEVEEVAARTKTEPDSQGPAPLGRVVYRNLWPGIVLDYEAGGGIARSRYRLAAGAKVEDIRLRYNVAIEKNEQGGLHLKFASGAMQESAPVAWQEKGDRRMPVPVRFQLGGNQEVGFSLGDYDPSLPVVIDPVLTWNTFLGAPGGEEFCSGIAVDASGNAWVTGYSWGWGNPVRAYSLGWDAFAARLDASGNLVWNTFLGGNGDDYGYGITVDGSGNTWITGYSTATWGSPVRAYSSGNDAFAARLDASGNLTWSTFLGGSGSDYGRGIAVDGSGNAWVTGFSPVPWGSPVRAYTNNDAFAARLDASGNLAWSTFLGGSGTDYGYGIAVDGSGNAWVTGYSSSTWGSPVRAYSGSFDAFAARLDASGNIVWHTFLGGSDADLGYGIAVVGSGDAWVTGFSSSTWGSPVRAYSGGNQDTFAVRLVSCHTRYVV